MFKMYGNLIEVENADDKVKELYKLIEQMQGSVMPHIKLHATYAFEDMDCFINPMKLTRNHPKVPLVWFALMRMYVAVKENFIYCKTLNKKMLNSLGVSNNKIQEYITDLNKAPLEEKEIILLKKAIKSIYDSHSFKQKDFNTLKKVGYDEKTIYEIITYSTNFMGVALRLNTYLNKEEILENGNS